MNGKCAQVLVVFAIASTLSAAAMAQSDDRSRQDEAPVIDTTWLRNRQARPTPADELLEALRRKRPISDLIYPVGVAADAGSAKRSSLLPEGATVIDVSGSLVAEADRWSFAFDSTGTEASIHLLPNANLDTMVRTARGASAAIRFAVSGEVTVFEGENYLIVRSVSRAAPLAVPTGVPSVKPESATPVDPVPGRGAPPAKAAADPTTPKDSDAVAPVADVLSALRNREPEKAMPIAPLPRANPRGSGAVGSGSLVADGTPVVRRPGRLIRDGTWWTFVFESDHPERPEPPLKLLPSQGVQQMVQASKRDNSGLVFLVSGEMTLFEDENYLLPRAVIRRINMGNLTK